MFTPLSYYAYCRTVMKRLLEDVARAETRFPAGRRVALGSLVSLPKCELPKSGMEYATIAMRGCHVPFVDASTVIVPSSHDEGVELIDNLLGIKCSLMLLPREIVSDNRLLNHIEKRLRYAPVGVVLTHGYHDAC
jgi:hypothetical protein